ncbi:MAG: O-antigen ligase family protein, partial [Actinomycetota bacterium]
GQGRWTRRRKVVLVSVIAGVLVVGGVGTAIASQASPDLRERARGFLHPLEDESVKLRLETWKDTLGEVRQHPLGTGVGSVGRASTYGRGDVKAIIADNSYLKILREQGWLGGPMFVVGIVVLLIALTLTLLDRSRPPHPIGLAALAGAFAFLVLGLAGEYVEQPGKVLAWLFLGIAILEVARARTRNGRFGGA